MKQRNYKYWGYIILIILINLPLLAEARNFEYEGHEIILDQPEGEIMYYNAKAEIALFYSEKDESKEKEFIIPIVKGNDNKVYIRNLFGTISGSYGYLPLWMEGFEEDGNIVFEINSLYSFHLAGAVYPDVGFGYPIGFLEYGKVNQDNGIEILNDIENITLKKNEYGYYIDIPEGQGLITGHYFITNFECKPTDNQYVFPPSGYKTEEYQINFKPATAIEYEGEASLRLNVVKTPDEIYIQGMSADGAGNSEAWLKGYIQGNKIVFPNAQLMNVGRDGKNMYFTPMNFYKDLYFTMLSHVTIDFIPTKRDLVFDYDEKTGRIYNPNSALGFTTEPNKEWHFDRSTMDLDYGEMPQVDFFFDMEFIKVPDDIEYQPLPLIDNKKVNYLDKNGFMMNPDDLFVVFYDASNDTPIEREYMNCNTLQKEWGKLYNYGVLYMIHRYAVDGIGMLLTNYQQIETYPLDLPKDYYAVLYYLPDGTEEDFQPDGSGIKEIKIENDFRKPSLIYDLKGNKYDNIQNLHPGVYIINGKKVLIHS